MHSDAEYQKELRRLNREEEKKQNDLDKALDKEKEESDGN